MQTTLTRLFTILTAFFQIHQAMAQGTAFTYQGQLQDGGSPANGIYNFQFSLFNAPTNGSQVGATVTKTNVAVTNGLFTVLMDFGPGVFTSTPNWLQVGVETNGSNTFAILTPTQQITPTPYAIYAPNAGLAASASSVSATNITGIIPLTQLPAAVVTNDAINLTIGGTNSVAPLTVPPKIPTAPISSITTGNYPQSLAVAGRYVYVVNEYSATLQIIDASVPSAPVIVGSTNTGGSPMSIAAAGRYAYVGCLGGNVLQIYDVSDPVAPVLVGSAPAGSGAGPLCVSVVGRYVYVVSYSTSNNFQIFDVSTPSAPILVNSVNFAGTPYGVSVSGHYAYVITTDTLTPVLQIYDVSDPSAPVVVGSVTSGGYNLAVVGRYAYIPNYHASVFQIVDVSNPAAPMQVGSINTAGGPFYAAVADRYVYVANYDAGSAQVIDVSNPSTPVIVGTFSTGGANSTPTAIAVCGRYLYLTIGGFNKLQIFDMGGAFAQQLEAGTMEAGTLQVRDSVRIGNGLDVRTGLTVDGSSRISGGLGVTGGLSVNSNALFVGINGTNVGIGLTNPAYKLQVNGTVAGLGAYNNVSDARYKTNITRLTHALEKIMALRGVEYDWRSNAFPQMNFERGTQLGFVAQEIKDVLPEVVSQDERGYYSIAYSKVIPVLVEAIKEQEKEMEKGQKVKDAEIEALKRRLDKLEQTLENKGANLK